VPTDTRSTEVCVIFGSTSDIASAVCRLLAGRGARLFLAARDADRLHAQAAELNASCRVLESLSGDSFEQCLAAARSELGPISGVANCVGSLLLKPAHRTSADEWETTLSVNLGSAFSTVRAASLVMRSTGGSVVLVSSAAALTGLPNHEAIAAAKAGIVGLTRSAAATYASSGLRFNAVAPGLVRTKMTQALWSQEKAVAGSVGMHPVGRLGEPQDVASAIAWLLDPANSWVTGQVVGVDGGLARLRGKAKV
jgi:3-oxoacyl-[acyl-carrier protein] reductase